ncbi:MAG: SDR family NAD(P)-dependent oxidoreductase, partial [Alphaproteobacteria bacterium]
MTDGTAQARRVAVVTGGAKGIGAEICARMAAAGHALRIADVDMEEAGRLAAGQHRIRLHRIRLHRIARSLLRVARPAILAVALAIHRALLQRV